MQQHKLPHIEKTALELPFEIQRMSEYVAENLSHRPKLVQLFQNCFPNTLKTTTKLLDDGTSFIFTGDIPAMWLRDSAEQVLPYIDFIKEDNQLRRIIRGLIQRHMFYINLDPYANAFNVTDNDWHWDANDQTDMSEWVWERKYELDSICFSIRLAYLYWQKTGSEDIFDKRCKTAINTLIDIWKTEQRHYNYSSYCFQRRNCPDMDTLLNDGKGMPVNYTGMIWSGFRPSDDACEFNFNIPSNMFAVVVLQYLHEILQTVYRDDDKALEVMNLAKEIEFGIQHYGIYNHPKYGYIYVYETDGFGNYRLMDDAGTPNLLSMPYLGYIDSEDIIYQNTRRFILSTDNPYYIEGKIARGLGSPHTPSGHVWHLGLTMQGLTATNEEEIADILYMLETTDAETGFMHEAFSADDPYIFHVNGLLGQIVNFLY